MFKITQDATGEPDLLKLIETGEQQPGEDEIAIRNYAAGVNPVDVAVSAGMFPLLGEPPFTVGWDVAGEVVAIGTDVTAYSPGDRVFGMPRFPEEAAGYATHIIAPAGEMAHLPKELSYVEGGALPLAGLTAWQALLTHGGLKSGQKVLVHGGAGGVGHLAVQIAKANGAHVTATASATKLDIVRELGADRVIDYAVSSIGSGYDLILDPQAGEQAEHSVAAANPGGTVIALLDPSEAAVSAASRKGVKLEQIAVTPDHEGLKGLAALSAAGKLKPIVAETFPLAEVQKAFAALSRRPVGKIVLVP